MEERLGRRAEPAREEEEALNADFKVLRYGAEDVLARDASPELDRPEVGGPDAGRAREVGLRDPRDSRAVRITFPRGRQPGGP